MFGPDAKVKRLLTALALVSVVLGSALFAEPARFVIDDDAYLDRITNASAKLLHDGKLLSIEAVRRQAQPSCFQLKLPAPGRQKMEPPALYDRLRESTLTVGSYYKCPDCPEWHFNGSAGFVVGETGVVCTCWHVVQTQDEGIKEAYLVAADSEGHVFPLKSVLAVDAESDTCLVKIDAAGLKPLPLRPGVRPGERVYCLSHPGGYYFMFSQGMVARLNLRRNEGYDEHGRTNGLLTRPVLFLNVTTEFAPGSSGGPVVDDSGNVVGQVASIADAGEPLDEASTNAPASPSVPVRFCTAAEEILRLTQPQPADRPQGQIAKPEHKPKAESRKVAN